MFVVLKHYAMNMNQLAAYGAFFTDLGFAQSYVYRAFETAGKSLVIVMYECPYYFVCSPRLASQLVKEGFELLP
jgi:hypothetical protein